MKEAEGSSWSRPVPWAERIEFKTRRGTNEREDGREPKEFGVGDAWTRRIYITKDDVDKCNITSRCKGSIAAVDRMRD